MSVPSSVRMRSPVFLCRKKIFQYSVVIGMTGVDHVDSPVDGNGEPVGLPLGNLLEEEGYFIVAGCRIVDVSICFFRVDNGSPRNASDSGIFFSQIMGSRISSPRTISSISIAGVSAGLPTVCAVV